MWRAHTNQVWRPRPMHDLMHYNVKHRSLAFFIVTQHMHIMPGINECFSSQTAWNVQGICQIGWGRPLNIPEVWQTCTFICMYIYYAKNRFSIKNLALMCSKKRYTSLDTNAMYHSSVMDAVYSLSYDFYIYTQTWQDSLTTRNRGNNSRCIATAKE